MPSDETEAFEHYRILKRADGSAWELGRGAMGVTYKALDDNLHKVVALKVINALHIDKESSRDRFLREARAAASLNHRNVAVVHHLGQNAQTFFYAMEFIDGETVDALVKRAGPLPWQDALDIVIQVTRALMAAHEKRLVHRDIKPANIMLVPELGEDAAVVKLIDFGLAKTLLEENGSLATVSGSGFVGTPLYASPEQCNEEAPDIRSDIYSLGATLWFMLTGQPLFNGPLGKVFAQHLNAPPPLEQLPAIIPGSVRTLLARMLAKDRAARPQTPADLRQEIDACLHNAFAERGAVASAPGTAAHDRPSAARDETLLVERTAPTAVPPPPPLRPAPPLFSPPGPPVQAVAGTSGSGAGTPRHRHTPVFIAAAFALLMLAALAWALRSREKPPVAVEMAPIIPPPAPAVSTPKPEAAPVAEPTAAWAVAPTPSVPPPPVSTPVPFVAPPTPMATSKPMVARPTPTPAPARYTSSREVVAHDQREALSRALDSDRRLNAVYEALRARLNAASKARLKEEQLQWLRMRTAQACTTDLLETGATVDLPVLRRFAELNEMRTAVLREASRSLR